MELGGKSSANSFLQVYLLQQALQLRQHISTPETIPTRPIQQIQRHLLAAPLALGHGTAYNMQWFRGTHVCMVSRQRGSTDGSTWHNLHTSGMEQRWCSAFCILSCKQCSMYHLWEACQCCGALSELAEGHRCNVTPSLSCLHLCTPNHQVLSRLK